MVSPKGKKVSLEQRAKPPPALPGFLPGTPGPKLPLDSFAELANLSTDLIEVMDRPEFFDRLYRGLGRLVEFDYFIVYHFEEGHVARLIHTNLDRTELLEQMVQYEQGLYLLDPFYVAATSQSCCGLYRMEQVAPADFRESEYFLGHYKKVPIAEELRYLVRIDAKQWLHVFLEKHVNQSAFSARDYEILKGLEPMVNAAMLRHWQWQQMGETLSNTARTPLGFGLRNVIGNLKGIALSEREIDVVELIIKGHSSKSIADILGIAQGTITNHRRNIYSKLHINSQGQLFHHFLQSLFG